MGQTPGHSVSHLLRVDGDHWAWAYGPAWSPADLCMPGLLSISCFVSSFLAQGLPAQDRSGHMFCLGLETGVATSLCAEVIPWGDDSRDQSRGMGKGAGKDKTATEGLLSRMPSLWVPGTRFTWHVWETEYCMYLRVNSFKDGGPDILYTIPCPSLSMGSSQEC